MKNVKSNETTATESYLFSRCWTRSWDNIRLSELLGSESIPDQEVINLASITVLALDLHSDIPVQACHDLLGGLNTDKVHKGATAVLLVDSPLSNVKSVLGFWVNGSPSSGNSSSATAKSSTELKWGRQKRYHE